MTEETKQMDSSADEVVTAVEPMNRSTVDKENVGKLFEARINKLTKIDEMGTDQSVTSEDPINRSLDKEHPKPDSDFNAYVLRLKRKDETLTEVDICNSTLFTQKESRFVDLCGGLYQNKHITNVMLANVGMKDNDCAILVEALATCAFLEILNVESNSLTTLGVQYIADMAEKHPSIREIRVSNQRLSVGVDAERALVNCLSQNTNITKLSHSFVEKFVAVHANKYIQRNVDLQRQIRANIKAGKSNFVMPELDQPPFPKFVVPEETKAKALKIVKAAAESSSLTKTQDVTVKSKTVKFEPEEEEEAGCCGSSAPPKKVPVPVAVAAVPKSEMTAKTITAPATPSEKSTGTSSRIKESPSSPTAVHSSTTSTSHKVSSDISVNSVDSHRRSKQSPLQNIIERLEENDSSLTDIILKNSNIASQEASNYKIFAKLLQNNENIANIELVNVGMKDADFDLLVEALTTCTSLEILNVESNYLSSISIEQIAKFAEKHPSLREIRLANQKMAVGVEAERALANCLSQNTNIIKLSHNFIEKYVGIWANKYVNRNVDLQRQIRANMKAGKTDFVMPELDPYPFPARKEDEVETSPDVSSTVAVKDFVAKKEQSRDILITPKRKGTNTSESPLSSSKHTGETETAAVLTPILESVKEETTNLDNDETPAVVEPTKVSDKKDVTPAVTNSITIPTTNNNEQPAASQPTTTPSTKTIPPVSITAAVTPVIVEISKKTPEVKETSSATSSTTNSSSNKVVAVGGELSVKERLAALNKSKIDTSNSVKRNDIVINKKSVTISPAATSAVAAKVETVVPAPESVPAPAEIPSTKPAPAVAEQESSKAAEISLQNPDHMTTGTATGNDESASTAASPVDSIIPITPKGDLMESNPLNDLGRPTLSASDDPEHDKLKLKHNSRLGSSFVRPNTLGSSKARTSMFKSVEGNLNESCSVTSATEIDDLNDNEL